MGATPSVLAWRIHRQRAWYILVIPRFAESDTLEPFRASITRREKFSSEKPGWQRQMGLGRVNTTKIPGSGGDGDVPLKLLEPQLQSPLRDVNRSSASPTSNLCKQCCDDKVWGEQQKQSRKQKT